jgi:threonine synthase
MFVDTRSGADLELDWKQAIFVGKAASGLIALAKLPEAFSEKELEGMKNLPFAQLATKVIAKFLGGSAEEIGKLCDKAYAAENWEKAEIIPIVKVGEIFHAEQWWGKTAAFKDIALSFLPQAMQAALRETDVKKILILGATSGDTGSAGEAGFAAIPEVAIAILYPEGGKVTEVQKRQMVEFQTADGRISAYSITDNFDFCQNSLAKPILDDAKFREELKQQGIQLSSLNSINIGRLAPQITTFFKAQQVIQKPFDVCVPSGNFGHALSAYFAKQLGAKIGKIIIATNENAGLDHFLQTGKFELGKFKVTNSPSMDISIPSNLERLLFHIAGSEKTNEWMESLRVKGNFEVDAVTLAKLQADFDSGSASETETLEEIKSIWETEKRILDPHTAVASKLARDLKRENFEMLVVETAHWGKFVQTIFEALKLPGGENQAGEWEIAGMQQVENLVKAAAGNPVLPLFLRNHGKSEKQPRQSGIHPSKEELKSLLLKQLGGLS